MCHTIVVRLLGEPDEINEYGNMIYELGSRNSLSTWAIGFLELEFNEEAALIFDAMSLGLVCELAWRNCPKSALQ